jgi:hypothetical protein
MARRRSADRDRLNLFADQEVGGPFAGKFGEGRAAVGGLPLLLFCSCLGWLPLSHWLILAGHAQVWPAYRPIQDRIRTSGVVLLRGGQR